MMLDTEAHRPAVIVAVTHVFIHGHVNPTQRITEVLSALYALVSLVPSYISHAHRVDFNHKRREGKKQDGKEARQSVRRSKGDRVRGIGRWRERERDG